MVYYKFFLVLLISTSTRNSAVVFLVTASPRAVVVGALLVGGGNRSLFWCVGVVSASRVMFFPGVPPLPDTGICIMRTVEATPTVRKGAADLTAAVGWQLGYKSRMPFYPGNTF
jgi:hypothetical protein